MPKAVDVVRALYAEFAQGRFDRVAPLFDPDVEFARVGRDYTGQVEGEWRGIDAMWAACYEWLSSWSDFREQLESAIELEDGRVLTFSRQTAVGRTSGFPLDYELGGLFTIRGGLIAHWEMHLDRAAALRAAGLDVGPAQRD